MRYGPQLREALVALLLAASCQRSEPPPAPAPPPAPQLAPRADAAVVLADASAPPAPPAPPARPVAVHPATACPMYPLASPWWLHELFSGCAAVPFASVADNADGEPGLCGSDCARPCGILDAATTRRSVTYDARGRVSAIRDDDSSGFSETFTYDGSGDGDQLATAVRTFNPTTSDSETATRDAHGRITELTPAPPDRGAEPILFMYDARGDLTYAHTGAYIRVDYTYDARHRLVAEHESERAHSQTDIAYRYDRGHLVERVVRMGATVQRTTYGYDSAGRLVTVDERVPPGGPWTHRHAAYEYDALGRQTRQSTREDDGDTVEVLSYDYACAGR